MSFSEKCQVAFVKKEVDQRPVATPWDGHSRNQNKLSQRLDNTKNTERKANTCTKNMGSVTTLINDTVWNLN